MLTLYDYVLSDDCYKVRLFLSILGQPFTPRKVNMHPGGENLTAEFRATVNPLGRIPVLVDGDVTLRTLPAILTYLALRYDPSRQWLPDDPVTAGKVAMWLAFADRDLAPLSALRWSEITAGTIAADKAVARVLADEALNVLDDHLAEGELDGRSWMVGAAPTIADIAVFGTAALASDAGVALEHYPALWRWIERVRHLPKFIVIPGVFPVFPEMT